MVGGGPGAFIGAVHRMATNLDGEFELVAGAFSSDPAKSIAQGDDLGLDPSRVYGSFKQMAKSEAALPAEERIQVVSIVTPNHLHHAAARAFLEAGIDVICDKPMTNTVDEAEDLCRLAADKGRLFCVTHNYTGYPMVKEARARIAAGALGTIRKIVVEYSQGWLATLLEAEGQKQASWRTDPAKAGVSSALGDIGSHAHNLAEYVTGLRVEQVFGDLGTVVEGRALEDDATLLLRFTGGVRGLLMASQIAFGERNHLRLRVYGSNGALDWTQDDPERLRLIRGDGSEEILFRGGDLSSVAAAHTRIPGGHPEGFIEAFANIYRNVGRAIQARAIMANAPATHLDFPTVQDGARGVHFIHAAVDSAKIGRWVDASYTPPG